jgi:antitoxin component YwqK of YwqJK toxin-antitoxin module
MRREERFEWYFGWFSQRNALMKKKQVQTDTEKFIAQRLAEVSREGLHQEFHPNGQLFLEWTVVNGKTEGVMREWNENGTLVREEPMRRGLVHGVVKQWNSKGKLLGEYKMEMGRGVIREWDEDGALATETEHVNKYLTRVRIYGDPKVKFHEGFLLYDRPISKKKFYELLRAKV